MDGFEVIDYDYNLYFDETDENSDPSDKKALVRTYLQTHLGVCLLKKICKDGYSRLEQGKSKFFNYFLFFF